MHGLDISSGVGALAFALMPWVRPLAYCEGDVCNQAVLLSAMARGDLHEAPIASSTREIDGAFFGDAIDIITATVPRCCARVARKRGDVLEDVVRLANETGAPFVFASSNSRARARDAGELGRALAEYGYDSRWLTLASEEISVPGNERRWFLAAHRPIGGKEWFSVEKLKAPAESERLAPVVSKQVVRARALREGVAAQLAREAFQRMFGISERESEPLARLKEENRLAPWSIWESDSSIL